MLKSVRELRRELHAHPELSGQEVETAERIRNYLKTCEPTEVLTELGGHGVAAVFDFEGKGPVVAFRCELDALPIQEVNDFAHASIRRGVSHKCGHDGHMAILSGLANWLRNCNIERGKVILLFQSAEETAEGAYKMIKDPRFKELNPEYLFALHNLPGEPLHSIIKVDGIFTPTVQSLAIYLKGKKSHASEPEKGINPAKAIAEILQEVAELNVVDVGDENFALLTPVHLKMGERAYGISPGLGELHYTFRAFKEKKMLQLKEQLMVILERVCKRHSLEYNTGWFDHFPATKNDAFCNDLVGKAAKSNGFEFIEAPTPYKFGEDFSWFSKEYKVAFFGLGAGKGSPALHHADYDFPDELLSTGVKMFSKIVELLLRE